MIALRFILKDTRQEANRFIVSQSHESVDRKGVPMFQLPFGDLSEVFKESSVLGNVSTAG
jgi:hypothetical protein